MKDIERQSEATEIDGTACAFGAAAPKTPKGIVALFIGPDGKVIASANDFHPGAPIGYSLHEAQELRARRSLALAVIGELASPTLRNAVDKYLAETIIKAMIDRGGCRAEIVAVGHDD